MLLDMQDMQECMQHAHGCAATVLLLQPHRHPMIPSKLRILIPDTLDLLDERTHYNARKIT
jgi:hypothetical protein